MSQNPKPGRSAAAMALLAALAVAAPALAAPADDLKLDRLQWEVATDGAAPITLLEIRNDFGDIRLRRAGAPVIQAHAVVQRLDREGAQVGFTVERRGSAVALVVSYPPGRIRDRDPDPPKDSYDRLDLAVHVPEGVAVRASTLRGQVEARRVRSDVEATTLDGAIHLDTTGLPRARTRGGRVHVDLHPEVFAQPGSPVLIETVSGPITVTLPARPSMDLQVETQGAITSVVRLDHDRRHGRATKRFGRHPNRRVLIWSADGAIRLSPSEQIARY